MEHCEPMHMAVDGGGTWRLDLGVLAWWRPRRLVGERVWVRGVRDGHDLLAVASIARVD